MSESILSLIIFSPLLGVALIVFTKKETTIKWLSAIITFITFALSLPLLFQFDKSKASLQFVHKIENWLVSGNLHIDYHFGLDGAII